MENYNNNQEFGWDSTIEEDGKANVVLSESDYGFKVTGFERGRFNGSEKLGACPKAILTLTIETEKGTATAKTDILLSKALEWKISSFFRCIGLKKHGQPLVMDWSKVPGATGKAHIKPKEYTNKFGQTRTYNEVAYFIDKEEEPFSDDDIPF